MRTPLFSIINIAGLSLGLCCCMLIFLYAKDEISYDRFHSNKENIYRITADITNPGATINKTGSTGMMPGPAFQHAIPESEAFVRIKNTFYIVKYANTVFEQEALYVDSNFFSMFSFPLIAGNPATALSGTRSVVFTEDAAEKIFGKKNALGEMIELNTGEKFEPFIIMAIAKKPPRNSSISFSMLLPIQTDRAIWDNHQWGNYFLKTFVLLKPGTDPVLAAAKFKTVVDVLAAEELQATAKKFGSKNRTSYGLQPLAQMHLSTSYPPGRGLKDASDPIYTYLLSIIALFVLLIACVNFINLTIAQSLRRAKEIGVRKVIGGKRKQLIIQFLGESFIITCISFLFAVVLVMLSLPVFNTLSGKALSIYYLLDTKLVAGYMILLLVTALLAGFYPALILSGFKPVEILYGKFKLTGKNYLSKILVVFQFTLASFLIAATTIMYTQTNYLLTFDLGYNDKNVLILNFNNGDIFSSGARITRQQFAAFRNELLTNSRIENVTGSQGAAMESAAKINGGDKISFDIRYTDVNFLPLFQIPVISGRNFSSMLSTDSAASVIVNESFVRAAGWKDPIGNQVDFFYLNKKYSVIGVIKDYHFSSLAEKIGPQLLMINPSFSFGNLFVKFKQGNASQSFRYTENVFKKHFPDLPCQYSFNDTQNAAQYAGEVRWKQIISSSSILTIIISCIGLFGLATLSARKRSKEIGIRKVLGASATGIAGMLCADFISLVALAAIISWPFGWWVMSHWLQNYPYHISLYWWMFGLPAIIVLVVALLTTMYQSVKTATANPMKSLRTD